MQWGHTMKLYLKDGSLMLAASSLERSGADLVLKGKITGTMPATIYIKPEEIWEARKLLSWPVIWYLPIMIVKGWWRAHKLIAHGGGVSRP